MSTEANQQNLYICTSIFQGVLQQIEHQQHEILAQVKSDIENMEKQRLNYLEQFRQVGPNLLHPPSFPWGSVPPQEYVLPHDFFYKLLFDIFSRHGIFPFFNGNPFFSEPFGSFLRSMQIRFNNFRGGGGGVMQLFSKFMVCQTFLCVISIG